MAQNTKILTAGGSLACAAAIGFVMQNADTSEGRYGAALAEGNSAGGVMLDVEEIKLTSGELAPVADIQAVDQSIVLPRSDEQVTKASAPQALPEPEGRETAAAPLCEVTASVRPVAAAMVTLKLDAACLPNERVTVHHSGMIFTQATSDTGVMEVTLPALAQNAVFIMAFTNGEGAVAQTKVEELADFDRMVLQWKGNAGFEIHAREFGADYGDKGHIWKDAPGDIAEAITGRGGYLTRLGDPDAPEALLAEVYSFPVAANRNGTVDLTVETEVVDMNCGLEIEAQTLEVLAGREMKTRNLTLSVPECDAAGTFLVLNNLLQDLKVAAN